MKCPSACSEGICPATIQGACGRAGCCALKWDEGKKHQEGGGGGGGRLHNLHVIEWQELQVGILR